MPPMVRDSSSSKSDRSDCSTHSDRSDASSISEWSGKVSKAIDGALDYVPDPAYLIDNKLTRGILKAPRSAWKGTGNAFGIRVPKSKREPAPDLSSKIASPAPATPAEVPSNGSEPADEPQPPPDAAVDKPASDAIARSLAVSEPAPHASRVEFEAGRTYDFGFGTLKLEEDPRLPLPRLIVRAAKKPIDNEGFRRVLEMTSSILEREQPFTILYDVRSCTLPNGKQIKIAQRWGALHSKRLNAMLQGITILISGVVVRSSIQMILGLCTPPQPYGIFADDEAAFAFARDKCTRVQVWSKKKRKNAENAAAGFEAKPKHVSFKETSARAAPKPADATPIDRSPGTKRIYEQHYRRCKSEPTSASRGASAAAVGSVRVKMSAHGRLDDGPLNRDSGRAMMARLAAINEKKLADAMADARQDRAMQAMQKSTEFPSRVGRLIERMSECGGPLCGRVARSSSREEMPAVPAPKQLEVVR